MGEEPNTMNVAAAKHNVSRATAYNIVHELMEWEKTATPEDEGREIMAQLKPSGVTAYVADMWLLTSDKLTFAYAQGHDGIGPHIFGGKPTDGAPWDYLGTLEVPALAEPLGTPELPAPRDPLCD
jgi:hypothetical protein